MGPLRERLMLLSNENNRARKKAQANDCIWVGVGNGKIMRERGKEESFLQGKRRFVLKLILESFSLLSIYFMYGPNILSLELLTPLSTCKL